MQKLFIKAFDTAIMEYSTMSNKFETTYHKPGGTMYGALEKMVHRVVDSVRDDTGCVRWSFLTYAEKEGKKVAIVSAYRVCKQTNPGDMTSSKQQVEIMYEDEELRPNLVDPQKHTLDDLQYFVDKLKAADHEVLILMDADQAEEQTYQPQAHNIKCVTKKGFHFDGTIEGFLKSFMMNCGLVNLLRQMHERVMPNTHAQGYMQIDFPLITSGLAGHVFDVGLLNRSVLKSDHSEMFFDLIREGIFEQHPDKLALHRFRNLKLDDPRISDKCRKILHKQFEHHNVYRRVKKISLRGKDSTWNLEDESAYEKLDDEISEVMKHSERMCNIHKAHATPWTNSLGQATHSIRHWDTRITRRGIRHNDDAVLNYCLFRSNVDKETFDTMMIITACIRQLTNVRSQLKDVLKDAKSNE
jgi:hypothetical protein